MLGYLDSNQEQLRVAWPVRPKPRIGGVPRNFRDLMGLSLPRATDSYAAVSGWFVPLGRVSGHQSGHGFSPSSSLWTGTNAASGWGSLVRSYSRSKAMYRRLSMSQSYGLCDRLRVLRGEEHQVGEQARCSRNAMLTSSLTACSAS